MIMLGQETIQAVQQIAQIEEVIGDFVTLKTPMLASQHKSQ